MTNLTIHSNGFITEGSKYVAHVGLDKRSGRRTARMVRFENPGIPELYGESVDVTADWHQPDAAEIVMAKLAKANA